MIVVHDGWACVRSLDYSLMGLALLLVISSDINVVVDFLDLPIVVGILLMASERKAYSRFLVYQ